MSNVWCAQCIITKTYKLTHLTDKFRNCQDKSYRNEKLFSQQDKLYRDA